MQGLTGGKSDNQLNRHKGRDRRAAQRGGAVKTFLVTLLVLGCIGLMAAGGGAYYGWTKVNEAGPANADTVVYLPKGSSVTSIGRRLKEAGVISYEKLFVAAVLAKKAQADLKAGEYELPAGASILEVIQALVEGDVLLHDITLPEGLTTAQILRLIEADEVLEGEINDTPPEGALLPETYAFSRGEGRDDLVRRMMTAQDLALEELWVARASGLPIDTPEEAIILASIVEKETGQSAERPRVAAVFVNRLRKGMRLESDPTIIYGLTGGEPLGRGIRRSELRKPTAYNTYVIRGLPPTPIANPGRASIAAVLNPAETDDLFFVADGTGGHVFAATLAEHNRNVARWRQIERERAARKDG